ncbi:MAG: RNA polymerase Rpb4 family protein [Candidatus Thermoplasmatota archaeon]
MNQAESKKRYVSIAEVKEILNKLGENREELIYEQKNAIEHADKFAKLSVKKTKELIKDLLKIEIINEKIAYKIADLLPTEEEEIKTIFAKEKVSLKEKDIKSILKTVANYYVE